jgi:predicted enzyme related to lactoylglutathione lyase
LTKDSKAAISFYGEVVGWKTQAFARVVSASQLVRILSRSLRR